MAEKNENIEKTLNVNYFEVQKHEIEVEKKSNDLLDAFSKEVKGYEKELKAEQKEVNTQKKDTNAKYKATLDSINSDHEKNLDEISKSTSKIEEINTGELEDAESLKEKEIGNLNKEIEKLEKNYVDQVEDTLKKYDKDVEKSNKEKEQVNKKAASDVENLNEKLQKAKEKHDEKVASLNEKRVEKVNKLTDSNNNKIDKVNADIAKEDVRIAKAIEDLKPVYDERLADIEEKIAEEKTQFDTKYSAIKSTLESKVARHEKFMNKNIKDNDQRAAKQHKKEIAILQKNGDKELKLLTGEHNDKFKVVDTKKKVLVQENLESIAAYSKTLIQFREEKLYQIESYKVILNSDVTVLKIETDSKIQDEINKHNEFERDNFIKVASVVLKQEIDLEQEDDTQAKLQIQFDKENNVNKVKQEEALAIKAKEINIVEENKGLTDKLSNLRKDIESSKLDNESKVAVKKLVLDIKVNEENEIIEYYNLDFVTQGQMSKENLSFQEEVKSLVESRADGVLAYEELEASNRAQIKVKFLETQKAKLEVDKEALVGKINSAFEVEQLLYDSEREKASSKDLEELKIYEEEANESIKKITDKRNALDPKAYKKEIKDLDTEITVKREELNSYVRTKRENITSNTVLFDNGIEEVNARREKALEESEVFFGEEASRILSAIELVNSNKNAEVNDAQDRHLKTFERTSLLLQNAQLRNNQLVEETTTYKMSRIQNENDVIKDFRDIFEKQKFAFKEVLDEALADYDTTMNSEESRTKENVSTLESNLEVKVSDFNKELQNIDNNEMSSLDKQTATHKSNYSGIEVKEKNQVSKVKNDFAKNENEYRANISEIDKASNDEAKNFESTKKAVKKDYELALAKYVNELVSKLQQDIKAI